MREAHRHSIETLKQQSEQELQTLRFELEDEGKAMLGKSHAGLGSDGGMALRVSHWVKGPADVGATSG